jgi:hypothetical protein
MLRAVPLVLAMFALVPVSAVAQVKACSLLTQADAEKLMGAPMKNFPVSNPEVCRYQEVTAKPNSMGPANLSLAVNKRSSAAAETAGWAGIKETRHLQDGQKNTKRLPGIGDEAWITGNTEKGKMGVAGIIVRKGNADFMLDSMVLEYRVSPDALKALAQKIAGQL